MQKDFYLILQIDRRADQNSIELAYRRLALRYHPDLNHSVDATLKMQEVNEAYTTLRNPYKRAEYDRRISNVHSPVRAKPSSRPATARAPWRQPGPQPRQQPAPPERQAPSSSRPQPGTKADEQERLVMFYLDGQPYGLDLADVESVTVLHQIRSSLITPGFVEGVITLRGRELPVVDLRKHLGFPSQNSGQTRIVLVNLSGYQVGLVVDAIENFLCVPTSAVRKSPVMPGGEQMPFIRGMATVDSKMVVLLDLNGLFSPEQRASLAAYCRLLSKA